MNFADLKNFVGARFAKLSRENELLFTVNVSGDDLWELYLKTLTPDENPLFKTRSTHDCTTCRHFFRSVANLVAVNTDGSVTSLWDEFQGAGDYARVAEVLADRVHAASVENRWLVYQPTLGVDFNYLTTVVPPVTFTHLFVNVDQKFRVAKDEVTGKVAQFTADRQVFTRALTEISPKAVADVIYLVDQDLLPRGAEHRATLGKFTEAQTLAEDLLKAPAGQFAITAKYASAGAVLHIRNSVIGSLLQDLSTGVELDKAIDSYGRKVAGDAYKRPQGIYTERMKADAAKRVEALGLTSALGRRCATADDVPVSEVLFIANDDKLPAAPSPFDAIASSTKVSDAKPRKTKRGKRVSFEQFTREILPHARSLEVFVENTHVPRFVSLTTAVDPTAGKLFAWDNSLAWAYTGNNADSVISKRVKAAGGVVDAPLCFRLGWNNTDDYDARLREPDGNTIYFGNNRGVNNKSRLGGCLDVDMNVHGETTTPVENIFYGNLEKMISGKYTFAVNNYTNRNKANFGFTVELQANGQVTTFEYPKFLGGGQTVDVVELNYDASTRTFTVGKSIPSTAVSRDVYGVPTESWCPVKMVTRSPNFWGDGKHVGNEHAFFILDGCHPQEPVRGFFNEYLRPELSVNRKVFEALGAQLTAPADKNGLAGLGFARASRSEIAVRVHGEVDHVVVVEF